MVYTLRERGLEKERRQVKENDFDRDGIEEAILIMKVFVISKPQKTLDTFNDRHSKPSRAELPQLSSTNPVAGQVSFKNMKKSWHTLNFSTSRARIYIQKPQSSLEPHYHVPIRSPGRLINFCREQLPI